MSMPADREIREIRVVLRPMREEDCGTVVRWRNQDRVRMNHVYRELLTEEGERQYFAGKVLTGEYIHLMACDGNANDGPVRQDMVGNEDAVIGIPFGCVVYHDYNKEEASVEGGLFIGEDYALGRGLGARMLELGAEYVRERLGVRTVTARVFEDNASSLAAHAKAGYVRRGEPFMVRCTDGEVKTMIAMEKRFDAR